MEIVVSRKVMEKSESYTLAYLKSSKELMNLAGLAVMNCFDFNDSKVLVICGSGNNAGDGYALAYHLKKKGIDVSVALVSNKFSHFGKIYFDMCRKIKVPILKVENADFSKYDILVDAIYGIGFKGRIPQKEAEIIKMINNSQKKVISIDINSGLDADSGLADICVKSFLTVSIGSYKLGHFLNSAPDNIGDLVNCNIGIPIIGEKICLMDSDDYKDILKKRPLYGSISDYGHIGIMGGSLDYSGAVKLSNMSLSSLRSGCGASRLIVPKEIALGVTPYLLESTLMAFPSKDGKMIYDSKAINKALEGISVLLIGSGWGVSREHQLILKYILENYSIPLIIDDDGIKTLIRMNLDILKKTKCKVILTLNSFEFSKLSNCDINELLNNPLELVRIFADKYNVIVVLKGVSTIITNGFKTHIVSKPFAVSKVGSGDVLAGIIAGVCGYNKISVKAVSCAVYINNLASFLANKNQISFISSDTINYIDKAICQMNK